MLECIHVVSCMYILSYFVSAADVQEQELEMFEVAKKPRHTLAIPSQSDEVQLQIPSILGFAYTHAGCSALLLLMLVVRFVV